MTGWTWLLIDVVGVALLGALLFYGQRQTAKRRAQGGKTGSGPWTVAATVGAIALAVLLLVDAGRRVYDLGTGEQRAERGGEIAKEATCQTTPGANQAAMSDQDCAFIASQIPVMASKTESEIRSSKPVPSPARPGADVPADVAELKPLPPSVTDRLPALRGHRYFLVGPDIVVVGEDAKIALVVNVKVRP